MFFTGSQPKVTQPLKIAQVQSKPFILPSSNVQDINVYRATNRDFPLRILIVTDAWFPQNNGVVRTLSTTGEELRKLGHAVEFVTPDRFDTVAFPQYKEIRLAYNPFKKMNQIISNFNPNVIHIATEGPLGLAARRYAVKNELPFTTSYHTKFPEYLLSQMYVPTPITYAYLKWFHKPSSNIMTSTGSLREDLKSRGFNNLKHWSRGVDIELFKPREKTFLDLPRPIFLYVGRVSYEKNIEAFLDLDLPGTKLVVGNGPQLDSLKMKYPNVVFTGKKEGEELANYYSSSDVFVFPSKTDTFGLVVIEALASGLPVAAYPVTGPIDIIGENSGIGVLSNDLKSAALNALNIPGTACREFILKNYLWTNCTKQFLMNLKPFGVIAKFPENSIENLPRVS